MYPYNCPKCGSEEPIEELENEKIDPEVSVYLCMICDATWIYDEHHDTIIN